MNNIITDHILSSLSITVMLSESTYLDSSVAGKIKALLPNHIVAHTRFRAQVIKSMLVRYCVILSKITQSISCFEQRLQRPSTGQSWMHLAKWIIIYVMLSESEFDRKHDERKYVYQLNSTHISRHHDQLSCIPLFVNPSIFILRHYSSFHFFSSAERHSFMHPVIHSCIPSFIHAFRHSFMHCVISSFIHLIHWFIDSFTQGSDGQ